MHLHVRGGALPFVHDPATVPAAECIVVPGARIRGDGVPMTMLADRLAAALDLFVQGKAPRIVVSGRGGGGLDVDEVAAMRRWLESRGVPAQAIIDDPLGLRTLDTMRRVRSEFGFTSAIVVSNDFHVERAVFLGRRCGLDARGVVAAPLGDYSNETLFRNRLREVFARVRAWLDAFVFGGCG